ncbi:hypothetical protein DPX39_110134700 [Trypanosoma brucei equiperdum]|uniref:Uncharacterized protein n=1 Tax=Trypanosoma brucei equiperdum TaxID=630700 RepID=A0A3L6L1J4_9TRYP|nr:hypothetical protein DPX39_110134700 [Trypanosoma brucei equiperdum]
MFCSSPLHTNGSVNCPLQGDDKVVSKDDNPLFVCLVDASFNDFEHSDDAPIPYILPDVAGWCSTSGQGEGLIALEKALEVIVGRLVPPADVVLCNEATELPEPPG